MNDAIERGRDCSESLEPAYSKESPCTPVLNATKRALNDYKASGGGKEGAAMRNCLLQDRNVVQLSCLRLDIQS